MSAPKKSPAKKPAQKSQVDEKLLKAPTVGVTEQTEPECECTIDNDVHYGSSDDLNSPMARTKKFTNFVMAKPSDIVQSYAELRRRSLSTFHTELKQTFERLFGIEFDIEVLDTIPNEISAIGIYSNVHTCNKLINNYFAKVNEFIVEKLFERVFKVVNPVSFSTVKQYFSQVLDDFASNYIPVTGTRITKDEAIHRVEAYRELITILIYINYMVKHFTGNPKKDFSTSTGYSISEVCFAQYLYTTGEFTEEYETFFSSLKTVIAAEGWSEEVWNSYRFTAFILGSCKKALESID